MDISALRKAMVAVTPPVRPPSPAVAQAVATELPNRKTVVAPDASKGAQLDNGDAKSKIMAAADAVRDVIERHVVVVDDKTKEIVYQAINADTGEVVRQVPAEINLKLRSYFRADASSDKRVSKVA